MPLYPNNIVKFNVMILMSEGQHRTKIESLFYLVLIAAKALALAKARGIGTALPVGL